MTHPNKPPEADCAAACLLGLAWGDVLGCPIEYWDKAVVADVYGHFDQLPSEIPFERLPPDRRIWSHLRPLGLHSDDTQQAVALIQTCLQPEGWQIARWVETLIRGEKERAWRGTGRFFREAVKALARGGDPLLAGSPSAGVGAAMRIAPIGALHVGKPAQLSQVVWESSLVTHSDVRACSIAYAVAAACAMLVEGQAADAVRHCLADRVRDFETEWLAARSADPTQTFSVSEALRRTLSTPSATLEARRRAICDDARPQMHPKELDAPMTPNHPFALIGGIHALCVGLWPEGTPGDLLGGVMREGGDTDTVGAITGALLGARFGTGWIPVGQLRDHEVLMRYADVLRGGELPESLTEFLLREREYTAEETAFMAQCEARLSV